MLHKGIRTFGKSFVIGQNERVKLSAIITAVSSSRSFISSVIYLRWDWES